jgi:uncharacterized protein
MSDVPQASGDPQDAVPTTPSQPTYPEAPYSPPASYPPPAGSAPTGYPQPAPGYQQPVGAQPMTPSDERLWAMLSHLGGLLLGFVAPLIVMLVFGERSPFVRRHAVESLNFQITLFIAYVIAGLSLLLLIGFVLLPAIWIGSIVLMIIAGMAANRGEDYRYPINIRLVH